MMDGKISLFYALNESQGHSQEGGGGGMDQTLVISTKSLQKLIFKGVASVLLHPQNIFLDNFWSQKHPPSTISGYTPDERNYTGVKHTKDCLKCMQKINTPYLHSMEGKAWDHLLSSSNMAEPI